MAERPGGYELSEAGGLTGHRFRTPQPERESHQELTPEERTRIEDNFRNYISRELSNVPGEWSEEKQVRHVVFEYVYDSHRAEYQQQLEGEIGRIRSLPFGIGNTIANAIGVARNAIYQHVPITEHVYNFAKEGAIGVAAARTVGLAANLLNITGGPISWLGAAGIGAATGALVGYRRGGERYVTKNLNAEKLTLDFEIDELVQKHANYFEHLQLLEDPRHVEGRRETGEYFAETDYARAAEVMEKLNRLAEEKKIRGTQAERAQLADKRAYLAAILEQRDFFDAISHRITSEEDYPNGPPPGQRFFDEGLGAANHDRLAKLWLERQEYRQQHSLAEQYKDGVSQEGKNFVEAHKAAAKKASWKGALSGGVSGAIFAGAFSYFLGERMPHGFGKGEMEGAKAIGNPLENRDFGSLTNVLEHVATTQENTPGRFFDDRAADAAEAALHRYGLPGIEHYVDPKTGTNHLFAFLNRASELGVEGDNLKLSLYHFLSFYDHPAQLDPSITGGTFINTTDPVIWRDQLANNLRFDQLADINTFNPSRELFIDQLRSFGKLNPQAIANLTGFVTQSPTTDYLLGGAAGYVAGQLAGQNAKAPEISSAPLTITPEQAAARGKAMPEVGQRWEILAHASSGQAAAVFQRLIHDGQQPPFYLRVNAVAGQRASVTFIDGNGRPLDVPFPEETISFQELIRDEGYQYRQPARGAGEAVATAQLSREAQEAITRINGILNTERDYGVVLAGRPGSFTIQSNSFDPTTGLPITITNLNDGALTGHINGYIAARAADPSARIQLRITGYEFGADGMPSRLRAEIVP